MWKDSVLDKLNLSYHKALTKGCFKVNWIGQAPSITQYATLVE